MRENMRETNHSRGPLLQDEPQAEVRISASENSKVSGDQRLLYVPNTRTTVNRFTHLCARSTGVSDTVVSSPHTTDDESRDSGHSSMLRQRGAREHPEHSPRIKRPVHPVLAQPSIQR